MISMVQLSSYHFSDFLDSKSSYDDHRPLQSHSVTVGQILQGDPFYFERFQMIKGTLEQFIGHEKTQKSKKC